MLSGMQGSNMMSVYGFIKDHGKDEHVGREQVETGGDGMRAEPRQRIDMRALKVWRLTGGVVSLFAWLLVLGVTGLTIRFGWLWMIPVGMAVLALLLSILQIVVVPTIRWRRWRYEVSENEVDLRYGVFVVTRTLIPMVRVQHVDTTQGPFLRIYNLASVTISTAAGQHEIPALAMEAADELRDRISELARVADDV